MDKYVVTMEKALQAQAEQLVEWKQKLIPECYDALCKWAMGKNDEVTKGDHIRRGHQLTTFVENWKPIQEGEKIKAKEVVSGEVHEGTYLNRRHTHLMKCQVVAGTDHYDFYEIYYHSIERIDHEPKARYANPNK